MSNSHEDRCKQFVTNEIVEKMDSKFMKKLFNSEDFPEFKREDIHNLKEDSYVIQWIRVSKHFKKRLLEKNEVVLDTPFGNYWGRQNEGYYYRDPTIREIVN